MKVEEVPEICKKSPRRSDLQGMCHGQSRMWYPCHESTLDPSVYVKWYYLDWHANRFALSTLDPCTSSRLFLWLDVPNHHPIGWCVRSSKQGVKRWNGAPDQSIVCICLAGDAPYGWPPKPEDSPVMCNGVCTQGQYYARWLTCSSRKSCMSVGTLWDAQETVLVFFHVHL